jgi:hypothetical protein
MTFLYPAIDKIPFRGRDRDLTTFMFDNDNPSREGAEAFFIRDAPAMFGPDIVGMRMGGTRRLTQLYAGKLGPFELPPGQPRLFTPTLVQACYPKVYVSSRLRTTWFDGSGSPAVSDPRLSVEGCGK